MRDREASGGSTVYGPRNRTEGWQPIDCGHLGAVLKQLAIGHFEMWMEQVTTLDVGKEFGCLLAPEESFCRGGGGGHVGSGSRGRRREKGGGKRRNG